MLCGIDEAERKKLCDARHDAYYAAMALKPGCKVWPTDVCVPISRLAECILKTRANIDTSNLTVPIVGHVGDGNFHLLFLIDPANEAEDLKHVYMSLIPRKPQDGIGLKFSKKNAASSDDLELIGDHLIQFL